MMSPFYSFSLVSLQECVVFPKYPGSVGRPYVLKYFYPFYVLRAGNTYRGGDGVYTQIRIPGEGAERVESIDSRHQPTTQSESVSKDGNGSGARLGEVVLYYYYYCVLLYRDIRE